MYIAKNERSRFPLRTSRQRLVYALSPILYILVHTIPHLCLYVNSLPFRQKRKR
jgi:hypothetical protein